MKFIVTVAATDQSVEQQTFEFTGSSALDVRRKAESLFACVISVEPKTKKAKIAPPPPIDVPELADAKLTLESWKEIIQRLISIHGKYAMLEMDAGHNNVSALITKSKTQEQQ